MRLWNWLLGALGFREDPVRSCEVYRSEGCPHVDGMLCNMQTCTIRKEFIAKKVTQGPGGDLLKKLEPGWVHQGAEKLYLVSFVVQTPGGRRFLFKDGCYVIKGLSRDVVNLATGEVTEISPVPRKDNT